MADRIAEVTNPREQKLAVCSIMASSYARMLQLRYTVDEFNISLDAEYNRLTQWWNNLGQDRKDTLQKWIMEFSKETEDVTVKVARQAVKRVSEWNSNQ